MMSVAHAEPVAAARAGRGRGQQVLHHRPVAGPVVRLEQRRQIVAEHVVPVPAEGVAQAVPDVEDARPPVHDDEVGRALDQAAPEDGTLAAVRGRRVGHVNLPIPGTSPGAVIDASRPTRVNLRPSGVPGRSPRSGA
jgi:hypothetical protein